MLRLINWAKAKLKSKEFSVKLLDQGYTDKSNPEIKSNEF